MLSAFLVSLREGVEASLVVGIILVYLSRTGRVQLARFVWYGVAAAAALSLGVAIALERWQINEDPRPTPQQLQLKNLWLGIKETK